MAKTTIKAKVMENNATQSLLTKGQKSSLDKTLSEHKAGTLKYYTIEQAKTIINNK